ncbi:MAG: prepilin-type N-terminal cleavage/methylation domain-containing protein [Gammaproteobacteria bacterium]|nr:prepilin-type N-terminal cleavage/methylation domain-containing protein [Gammaproteobacteria bacterium]
MTLIELVIVIVVLGIIAGVATVKMNNSMSFSSGIQATKISQDIRHAQSLAINWGCELDFTTTTTNYAFTNRTAMAGKICNTAGSAIKDPATGNNFSISLKDGVTFTAGIGTFYFDSLGRPNDNLGLLTTPSSFTISGNNAIWTIVVSPITGFVTSTKL